MKTGDRIQGATFRRRVEAVHVWATTIIAASGVAASAICVVYFILNAVTH